MHDLNVLISGPLSFTATLNELKKHLKFKIILNEKNGKPFIKLINKTKKNVEKKLKKRKYKISLSLTDEDNYAVAFVTLSL